jgi:hypothetical protein
MILKTTLWCSITNLLISQLPNYLIYQVTNNKPNTEMSVIRFQNIVTCKGFGWRIIMDSGLDEWIYWNFFTITVNYSSSHIELLLNECSMKNLRLIRHYFESESELLYDWRFTASQFVLATSPLRPKSRIFIFQLNICGYSPYVTSSLTKGWVCRLQFLLVLASAFILRSETRGSHDHILLTQIRDFQTWRARSQYL